MNWGFRNSIDELAFRSYLSSQFLIVDSANERVFLQQLLYFPSYYVQISKLNWGVISLSMLLAATLKDYGNISKTSTNTLYLKTSQFDYKGKKKIKIFPWNVSGLVYPEYWSKRSTLETNSTYCVPINDLTI